MGKKEGSGSFKRDFSLASGRFLREINPTVAQNQNKSSMHGWRPKGRVP